MGKTQAELIASALGKPTAEEAAAKAATDAAKGTDAKPEAKSEAKPEAKVDGKPAPEGAKKPQSAPTLEQSAGKKAADSQKPAQGDDKKGAEGKAVPEWKLIDLKNQIGEMKQSQAEDKQLIREAVALLQDLKSKGSTKSEEKSELDAFAEKWQANPDMIKELAKVLTGKDAKAVEQKLIDAKPAEAKPEEKKPEEKPAEEAINGDQLERAIDSQLEDFVKEAPEYGDIVNPDTIKAIVFSNPSKYLKQNIADIVEEAYGKALPGKRSADGYKAAGAGADKIDYSKVDGASDEWKQIQADPNLKTEYQDNLITRLKKRM